MKQKGFTYIVIAVILITLVTTMLLVQPSNKYSENNMGYLITNYKTELNFFLENNFTTVDLNTFNYNFYNYIKSHNYNIKICTIIDYENNIYLSNFLGEDFSELVDKNTISQSKLSQDYNISDKCIMDYNSSQTINYYIEIYNDTEKIVEKN